MRTRAEIHLSAKESQSCIKHKWSQVPMLRENYQLQLCKRATIQFVKMLTCVFICFHLFLTYRNIIFQVDVWLFDSDDRLVQETECFLYMPWVNLKTEVNLVKANSRLSHFKSIKWQGPSFTQEKYS